MYRKRRERGGWGGLLGYPSPSQPRLLLLLMSPSLLLLRRYDARAPRRQSRYVNDDGRGRSGAVTPGREGGLVLEGGNHKAENGAKDTALVLKRDV